MRKTRGIASKGLLACVTAALLSACGGGGGGDTSTPSDSGKGTAEGIYTGTISANSNGNTTFNTLILEDGHYWTLYGAMSNNVFYVEGLIEGQGTSNNGSFTSTNLRDFGTVPATSGSLNATYVAKTSLSGTVSNGQGSLTITGQAAPTTGINYDTPATLSSVAGAWTLGSTSGDTLAVNIGSDGRVTAMGSSQCAMTGTIAPRASGKNVFNVALTFANSSNCALPGQAANGIGVLTNITGGLHQLTIAVVDTSRSYGSAAIGSR